MSTWRLVVERALRKTFASDGRSSYMNIWPARFQSVSLLVAYDYDDYCVLCSHIEFILRVPMATVPVSMS